MIKCSSRVVFHGKRCTHYPGSANAGSRCENPATGWLFAPGAEEPVPGGPICACCADRIIEEYRDKIHQEWRYEAATIHR